MTDQGKILKWAKQLCSEPSLFSTRVRRVACQRLASDKTPQTVPFLVSVIAGSDKEISRIAEEALGSLSDPQAIEALLLGYAFTKDESVRRILTSLGRELPEAEEPQVVKLSEFGQLPSPGEQAWQLQNGQDGTILAFVPEGDFLAGKEEFRVHLLAYYLALTCVTNAQYAEFLSQRRPNPAKLARWISPEQSDVVRQDGDSYVADPQKTNMPVVWVTWEGAAAYCKWAHLRLPSELEWEKGARGVDGRLYPWGNEWEQGRPRSTGAERKPEAISSVWAQQMGRSPYGLYQMIGNIYEWCADWYEEKAYERYARGDLRPPGPGEHRVLRGGPWRFGTLAYLRTEYRKSTVWRGGTLLCGFRCAKSL